MIADSFKKSDWKISKMFQKNPNLKTIKKPTSAIPQKLLKSESLRPSSLVLTEPSFDYPGLSFIDSEDDDVKEYDTNRATITEKKVKAVSHDDIECQPRKLQRIRALDSPTKSLHLDFLNEEKEALFKDNRRSSLCILALKAAAHASSPILKKSSQPGSLNSMISLPGVPPVLGVNDAQQVQMQRQKSKKMIAISSPRLQSEEDLILKLQRKQEFSEMVPTKLKEESDILHNIQKKEMADKISKGSIEKREKVEKLKIQNQFGIASGILKSKALFLAPITGMENEHELLIPPPVSDHPNERRIVRRVVSARLYQSPELVVQAETRFSESPFVLECLEWHNLFRKRHLSPELTLDPLVRQLPN